MSEEIDPSLAHLCVAASVWLCALTSLCLGLRYAGSIRIELPDIMPATPFVTPTLDWPTPSPTNTPRPTPTNTPVATRAPTLRGDELDAVAAAVAYEALNESERGQRAVAYVILHRCELTGEPPREVLTREFFGDEEGTNHLGRWRPDGNPVSLEMWRQITAVAIDAVNGWSLDEFPTSTHFYSTCILEEPPTWTRDLELLGCIDCHCFYGPKGG